VGTGRGGRIAQLAQRVAQVVVGLDVIRLEPDRAAVRVAGGVDLARALERDAPIVLTSAESGSSAAAWASSGAASAGRPSCR
jgi:hypothetical protein